MNEIPKGVFTKKGFAAKDPGPNASPAEISWATSRIFDEDLTEGIQKLKAGSGKPIVALGGAGFMRSLITAGLIDEFTLAIHPVILGSGFPIFTDVSVPLYLKLIDAKVFPGGIVVHRYGRIE